MKKSCKDGLLPSVLLASGYSWRNLQAVLWYRQRRSSRWLEARSPLLLTFVWNLEHVVPNVTGNFWAANLLLFSRLCINVPRKNGEPDRRSNGGAGMMLHCSIGVLNAKLNTEHWNSDRVCCVYNADSFWPVFVSCAHPYFPETPCCRSIAHHKAH